MTPHAEDQRELRRYLLGTLHEDAGRRVEERLMTEVDFLEEVAVAEGELIDDYVAGRLDAAERREFERHFLSTDERRRQLRFTQALRSYASSSIPQEEEAAGGAGAAAPQAPGFVERLRAFWAGRTPALRAGLAFACVAVVACAVWLALRSATRTPPTFVALALAADAGDRAAGSPNESVKLPLGADELRITLALPEGTSPAARYRAELLSDKGRRQEFEAAAHDARTVTVAVPESGLARGRYILRLVAIGDGGAQTRVGSYAFDVE